MLWVLPVGAGSKLTPLGVCPVLLCAVNAAADGRTKDPTPAAQPWLPLMMLGCWRGLEYVR
jgi:hypothetical protein